MKCIFCGSELQSKLINDDSEKRFFCTCEKYRKFSESFLIYKQKKLELERLKQSIIDQWQSSSIYKEIIDSNISELKFNELWEN